MRSVVYIFILFFGFTSCTTQTKEKTETFKVWGNCEKCKKTIENSINIDGVIEKDWNNESTLMTVKFDTTIINLKAIQQHIANAGYDNDGFYGDDYAYGKLPDCCQYERKPFELK
jgi:periplasmic mercuric ion binding protein